MVLSNLHLINSTEPVNIGVKGRLISSLSSGEIAADELKLSFNNAIALPGLINSHDHLDFNLFPQFGDRFYDNYTQWGAYIHQQYKDQINKVLLVPLQLRAAWGVYKNLIAGVTTVVDHSDGQKFKSDLINVVQAYHCLHSVQFEKRWKRKLNNPLKFTKPYVVHVAEGVDELAHQEVDELLKWNLFNKKLVGIHGVAMEAHHAEKFKGLVWCPQSNCFLLNSTADIKTLKEHTPILFGTDSTLTSDWNIWEHLRLAMKFAYLNADELLQSLTTTPANIWKLNTGELVAGKDADIIVAKKKASNMYNTNPEDLLLVMHRGSINLFDEEIYQQLADQGFSMKQFDKVKIGNAHKYVAGNVVRLMDQIRSYYPEAIFPVVPA
jgi:cytosine/adenosine deaminase-related metal-dependent hydrolase